MELETMHDRGFYLGLVKDYPPLERVIAGEITLTEMLDERVGDDFTKPADTLGDYLELVSAISDLSCDGDMKDAIPYRSEFAEASIYKSDIISGILGVGFFLGAILPPTTPILVFLLGDAVLGGGIGAWIAKKQTNRLKKKVQEKREELLSPIYDAVRTLDTDVGKCFIINHYHNARPRFEQTYRSLTGDELKAVDAQLHSYLGAGGMRGMDQDQLKDYLTGLLVPQVESDA